MSAMCDAITPVHGTPYDYGSICSWFGLASGGSIDTTVSATSRAAFAPSTRKRRRPREAQKRSTCER